MPSYESPYLYLVLLARERLVRLLARIDRLHGQRYATNVASEFLSVCKAAVSSVLDELEAEASLPDLGQIQEDHPLFRVAEKAHTLVDYLDLHYLRPLETAAVPYIDVEWLLAFSRMVREMEPGARLLFSSITEKNYYTWPQFGTEVKEFLDNLGCSAAARDLPTDMVVIGVCSSSPSGPLGYALAMHEIAHILCSRRALVEKLIAIPGIEQHWNTIALKGIPYSKRARGWLEEWLCDAIGSLLAGPSFALAAFAFARPLFPDTGDQVGVHPPWQLRFPVMFSALLGQTPALDYKRAAPIEVSGQTIDIGKLLTDWQSILAPLAKPTARAVVDFYGDLAPFSPAIISLAREQCASFLFDVDKYNEQVHSLVHRLALGIPPNEVESWAGEWRFEAPSLAAILNACWIYELSGTQSWHHASDIESFQDKISRFHGIINKAVELAEVKRLWS